MPAFVLLIYVGAGVKLNPPVPVTDTLHGVSAVV